MQEEAYIFPYKFCDFTIQSLGLKKSCWQHPDMRLNFISMIFTMPLFGFSIWAKVAKKNHYSFFLNLGRVELYIWSKMFFFLSYLDVEFHFRDLECFLLLYGQNGPIKIIIFVYEGGGSTNSFEGWLLYLIKNVCVCVFVIKDCCKKIVQKFLVK